MLDIIYDHDYMHVLHVLCVYNPLLHAFDQMTVTCAFLRVGASFHSLGVFNHRGVAVV